MRLVEHNMDLGESIFVKCDCGCNVLEINSDEEYNQFNFTIWSSHGATKPLSKKERIRWCEQVMKTGKPWADYTIVNKKDAQRIVKFLNKYLLKYGKTKKD